MEENNSTLLLLLYLGPAGAGIYSTSVQRLDNWTAEMHVQEELGEVGKYIQLILQVCNF